MFNIKMFTNLYFLYKMIDEETAVQYFTSKGRIGLT